MPKKDVNSIESLTAQLAKLKRKAAEIKQESEVLRRKIIHWMDENQTTLFTNEELRVTLSRGERTGFNKDAFKAEHPVMFARYQTKITNYETLKLQEFE